MTTIVTLPAEVLSVHDGDTVTVRVTMALPLDLEVRYTHPLRLEGCNCPELSTPQGIVARAYTVKWLVDHPAPYTLTLHGEGRDKYGRLLGNLKASDGHSLSDDLIAAGQAVVMKVARQVTE